MIRTEFNLNDIDSAEDKIELAGVKVLDDTMDLSFAITLACFTHPRKKQISIGRGEDATLRIIKTDDADKVSEEIADKLKAENIAFDELPKLRAFTNTYFNAHYFVTQNQTIIVVSGCEACQNWYLLQSFIPLYLPKMFEEQPITNDEQNMLLSLIGNSYDTWIENVSRILNSFGFDRMLFNQKILRITRMGEQKQLETIRQQIMAADKEIENQLNFYKESLRKLVESKKIYELKKFAFETRKEDRSLVDYLDAHQNVKVLSVTGDTHPEIILLVCGYIDMFDADMFKSYVRRGGNPFYKQLYGNIQADEHFEDFKLLMDALFMPDSKYKIRSFAGYKVACGRGVTAISSSGDNIRAVNGNVPENRLENPHYARFHCLGQNGPTLNKAAIEGDYVRMFEIMQVAAGNVNIAETSQTFAPFCRIIWQNRNNNILEDLNGNQVSPVTVIETIKRQVQG